MSLASGTRVGPYEVIAPLGAGGMGEVYRARDTKLGRDVAIKVLPEAFAADPERLARFEREAQILASLNHPNIAGIHGIEDAGGVRALVLEFVDGPTLADRIAQGRMPLEEARPIARQIAEALEAAHEHGIVHRDLKPANIKLRPDGTVKVLDFGLAKALGPPEGGHYVRPGSPDGRSVRLQPDLTASPTITSPVMATGAGVILGTAAYMSPEQARGHAADKRSDVWAFCCVLYEMLTGRRAFDGEEVSDTLAAILRGEPDWSALPCDLPPAIAEFMKGSLAKDRRRRIADLAVASFVLAESSAARDVATGARPPRVFARRAIAASAVTILAGAGLAGAWWMGARSTPAEPGPVTRFVIPLRSGERFSQNNRSVVAISPDGTSLAYVANGRLNLRRIDQLDSVPIRGTESGANLPGAVRSPFFSPDGRWIGFWQDGQIKKIPLAGGAAVSIAAVTAPFGATWEDDGTIVFAERTTIWRVSEAGGTPEPLVRDLKGVPQNPQLLDGARAVLFTLFPARGEGPEPEIVVHSLDSGRQQTLIRGGIDARYVPTGHLMYFSNGTLLAVPFDLRALNTAGSPVAVAENVASGVVPGRLGNGIAQVAVSATGTLAYLTGNFLETGPRALVSVDRLGREEFLGLPPRAYLYPRLSPDGTRIALTVRDPEMDIWIWDIARKMLSRFTFDPADDRYSSWSPDGRWIVFGSTRGSEAGVWRQAADGTGVPERLAAFPFSRYNFLLPTAMTPDGSRLVATATTGGASAVTGVTPDVFVVGSGADGEPMPLLQSGFAERNADLSPDGAWVAYESSESGQFEVYVRPFPDVPGGKWQISTDGGSQALWSRDGNELFFVATAGGLMSVRVERGGPLKIGTPTKVLDGSYVWTEPNFSGRLYDVTPDGRRFILLKDAGLTQQTNLPGSITVVQNWDQELKRLVPVN